MQKKKRDTYKIQISGRVQGVGFRPFIFNLALKNSLQGSVCNNNNGVVIYINATDSEAQLFLSEIYLLKPAIAIITSSSIHQVESKIFTGFSIVTLKTSSSICIPLTPDFSVCSSCKSEISTPSNRRYKYGFTTCVECGPRYSITEKYPFEREHTTIHKFTMCLICSKEYTSASDKRFHSQTNSCKTCGVQLIITDAKNQIIETNQAKIIDKIANLIRQGKIVAIKNTNGYLLCCDATQSNVVSKLRDRKRRPSKPFAVLYPSIESIEKNFRLSDLEREMLQSNLAPIVIIKNPRVLRSIAFNGIAPNINQTGVMLPSSALLQLLMNEVRSPIVATSGNLHGSPIISDEKTAGHILKNVADYMLHHDLDIKFPQDDSVIKFAKDIPIILRRSRGLAPSYLDQTIPNSSPTLAMGAQLKSTFTFLPNEHIYTSQYFGDLDSYDVFERFKNTINTYFDLFDVRPSTILVDSHPQYQSTLFGNLLAQELRAEIIPIQHHKAHFASVLGEHQLFDSDEKILGVVWDGLGLGDDKQIWGGEFFTYEMQVMKRVTHFEYFDWLLNDKMAKEPRLAALSLLNEDDKWAVKAKFSDLEWHIYNQLLQKNRLKTSSVGRLFDAVACLLNLVDQNSYEAEAGLILENCANKIPENSHVDFLEGYSYDNIPTRIIIRKILDELEAGASHSLIAASFIFTLAKSIITISKKEQVKTIACSGGVFQNATLVSILQQLAKQNEINLKINCNLSTNDENISFGQLMYYNYCRN